MAFFGSSWNEETYESSNKKEIDKVDVMIYLKKHPELLDEIILMMRKEKIKKIRKK